MNLQDYEQTKFALAEILRSAALRSRTNGQDGSAIFRELFARLAEDRFNIVVVGRFNRGKTSLMNALLGTTRLPVGILPLTSVITTVAYGSVESASIEYAGQSIPQRISLDELNDYVTELGNPGNARNVASANVQLPAMLLRRGFHFIDTPGVGSSIVENTKTTRAFLPEADAVLLVTSYDSPLSEDEMQIIDIVRKAGRRLFFIVNKVDLVTAEERARILPHIAKQLCIAGCVEPEIFSVSARAEHKDGIDALRSRLVRFLVEERQREFLRSMCDRTLEAIETFPGDPAERESLLALAKTTGARHAGSRGDLPAETSQSFSSCQICGQTVQAVVSFLSSFQFQLVAEGELREALADGGGFCDMHAWQYEALAGPRGTCIALAPLLEEIASRLLQIIAKPHGVGEQLSSLAVRRCPVCAVQHQAEDAAIGGAMKAISGGAGARVYCFDHFERVVSELGDASVTVELIRAHAEAFRRLAEDMQKYVLKFDGIKRYLMADEERDADKRALTLLAGSRGFHGLSTQG